RLLGDRVIRAQGLIESGKSLAGSLRSLETTERGLSQCKTCKDLSYIWVQEANLFTRNGERSLEKRFSLGRPSLCLQDVRKIAQCRAHQGVRLSQSLLLEGQCLAQKILRFSIFPLSRQHPRQLMQRRSIGGVRHPERLLKECQRLAQKILCFSILSLPRQHTRQLVQGRSIGGVSPPQSLLKEGQRLAQKILRFSIFPLSRQHTRQLVQ